MATDFDRAEIVWDCLAVLSSIGTSAHVISSLLPVTRKNNCLFTVGIPPCFFDKRYLIYKIFYPPFRDPELISEVMAVYDLSALAAIPSSAPTTARWKPGQIPPSERMCRPRR